jgi:hypothetical protein
MSIGDGHCFQFTPGGVIPYGEPVISTGEQVHNASAESVKEIAHGPLSVTPQSTSRIVSTPVSVSPPAAIDPSRPLTGAQLFAGARARIREIDRQLRAVPALQSERAQLAALMLAAKSQRKSRKNVQ